MERMKTKGYTRSLIETSHFFSPHDGHIFTMPSCEHNHNTNQIEWMNKYGKGEMINSHMTFYKTQNSVQTCIKADEKREIVCYFFYKKKSDTQISFTSQINCINT